MTLLKKVVIYLLMGVLTLACIFSFFYISELLNDWSLVSFANNLYKYPLPEKTKVISCYKKVGNLSNGNHCDFLASIDLVTTLKKQEIEKYYKDLYFPAAHKSHGKVKLFIYFKENNSLNDKKLFYSLEIVDEGYGPGLDLRCN